MNKKLTSAILGFLLVIIAILICGNQANAQTFDWTNTSNSNSYWQVNTNWTPLGPPGSSETARFNANQTYEVWWNSPSSSPQFGSFQMLNGDVTFVNQVSTSQYKMIASGSGGSGAFSDFSISGGTTSLTSSGLNLISSGGAQITGGASLTVDGSHSAGARLTVNGSTGFDLSGTLDVQSGAIVSSTTSSIGRLSGSTGMATVNGAGSQWNNSSSLAVGYAGNGTLTIESGGVASNSFCWVGRNSGSTGLVTVTGTDSQWNNTWLFVGFSGNGTLNVDEGGTVSSTLGIIGNYSNSSGVVNVSGENGSGIGSQWNVTGGAAFEVARDGTGTLNIEAGGRVSNSSAMIGRNPGSIGTATVSGSGSQWDNLYNMYIGGSSNSVGGTGTLNINDDGLVTVPGITKIWSTGTVNLDGGRFEFGQTSLSEFASINAISGSLAGNLDHAGFTDVATLTSLQNSGVDLTDVTLTNSGTLYGQAALGNALINTTIGEVQTTAGQQVRFAGTGNTNAGEINNFGGVVRFEQEMTNQNGGFISGRGQLIANGGWTNEGVMAFSGGATDILGDVDNASSGMIVTSGAATTTFYDDVVHNGSEIRTALGSNTVFFGDVSGAGSFTGAGTVFFESDLRPGNSPDIVSFAGDVVLGSLAVTHVELAGNELGEFDQLVIDGDLALNGDLQVDLIDGFQLSANQQFMIAEVGGDLIGQFNHLNEGALVGSFNDHDLFITYGAGDGNDVGLFTAVPEPNSALCCLFGAMSLLMIRRRRRLSP